MDIERIDGSSGRRALHRVAATREIERLALAASPPFALMARAGDAVARLALAVASHAQRVVVFAGPGNNGGDGLVAATRLQAMGRAVSVVLVADTARLPADAQEALSRAHAAGVAVRVAAPGELAAAGAGADLVIDALLGIGVSRAPEGAIAASIERIAALRAAGARVLAVDVPSGLDADRGCAIGPAAGVADDTLCLLTAKPGLFTAEGRDHAGRVWLAPIGFDADGHPSVDGWLVGRGDPTCVPMTRRHAQHKGSFGDVAVLGGAPGMQGAALLGARAAHAAGAGRVFIEMLGSSDASAPMLDPTRPELMWRHGWSGSAAETLRRTTVVCGCGAGDSVRAVLPRLLSIVGRIVLDADALNAIAVDPALQAQLSARARRGLSTVLTPHPLEAARLLGSTARTVQADRLTAAHSLAERYAAVAVLKGSGTVIACPGEPPRIGATGNAALATAGTGDVLAGWIGGRWAADTAVTAFDVATRAVVEHGAAAEPERTGSLRAGDLVEALHHLSRG